MTNNCPHLTSMAIPDSNCQFHWNDCLFYTIYSLLALSGVPFLLLAVYLSTNSENICELPSNWPFYLVFGILLTLSSTLAIAFYHFGWHNRWQSLIGQIAIFGAPSVAIIGLLMLSIAHQCPKLPPQSKVQFQMDVRQFHHNKTAAASVQKVQSLFQCCGYNKPADFRQENQKELLLPSSCCGDLNHWHTKASALCAHSQIKYPTGCNRQASLDVIHFFCFTCLALIGGVFIFFSILYYFASHITISPIVQNCNKKEHDTKCCCITRY